MSFASLDTPRVSTLLPGLAVTGGIVLVAFALHYVPGFGFLSPLILAILLGVGVRNIMGLHAFALPGMHFALRRLLRAGIVLLGLQLTLGQVMEVGATGLSTIVIGLVATFGFTLVMGRWLGVERGLARLIATGTSICGASAVLAANAVGNESDEDVAYAIASVTIFGTLAMILFPLIGNALHMDPRSFGLWSGASIHEVAQVVAAGGQGGAQALGIATISKLTRVALLAPVILVMARSMRSEGRAPFPIFVLGFLAMVGVASSGLLPVPAIKATAPVTQALLAMGLAAMGLQTDIKKLRAKGLRPLALGAISSVFIAALVFTMVKLTAGI